MDSWGLGWDKENGIERDNHPSALTKEVEVARQEIETNIGGYTKNRQG